MRHLVTTVVLLGVVAIGVGVGSYRLTQNPAVLQAVESRDALAWLKADFQLDDAQFVRIRTLHESYSIVCEEHCRAIQIATRERNALKTAPVTDRAVLAAADERVQVLRGICETAIAAHVRQVAAEMAPEQGSRYLALVLPKIADFDHAAAPDVGLSRHRH